MTEPDWEIDRSIQDLYDILSLKRRRDSEAELILIEKFLIPAGLNRDGFGNWFIRVGDAPVLWSCHTDTVHTLSNENDIYQRLSISRDGVLSAQNSSCLGADCGAGVWLMLRMLQEGIEGLYIFHREEEIGGNGSKWIAENTPELLKDIQFAIAFDRRDNKSIITYQWGGRCCSDAFAESLALELGMGHAPDPTGMFTDTANYTHLIPECTNLSVGYLEEHTYRESLDTNYLKSLLENLLKIKVENLVVERKVTDLGYEGYWEKYGDSNDFDELEDRSIRLIRNNPTQVVSLLREWGVLDDVLRELEWR